MMLTPDGTCPWLVRGTHARLRSADIHTMWPSILARADTMEEARAAWEVFLLSEGQGHWHCACGAPILELFRTLTITITGDDDDARATP